MEAAAGRPGLPLGGAVPQSARPRCCSPYQTGPNIAYYRSPCVLGGLRDSVLDCEEAGLTGVLIAAAAEFITMPGLRDPVRPDRRPAGVPVPRLFWRFYAFPLLCWPIRTRSA